MLKTAIQQRSIAHVGLSGLWNVALLCIFVPD
jgi:hypothetical protein